MTTRDKMIERAEAVLLNVDEPRRVAAVVIDAIGAVEMVEAARELAKACEPVTYRRNMNLWPEEIHRFRAARAALLKTLGDEE